ncbi:MAG: hypothetical protein H6661_00495 [Ardenticatenaceae bacterium]|nr:hypothetical protein [Ardenticatenaceae bacterium]
MAHYAQFGPESAAFQVKDDIFGIWGDDTTATSATGYHYQKKKTSARPYGSEHSVNCGSFIHKTHR